MVELQIVILAVAGSSPVGHPLAIADFVGSLANCPKEWNQQELSEMMRD